jgi:hypothetical protein
VPLVLTSLEYPHRYADAYLCDSLLDGVAFDRTEIGQSLLQSSLADASALFARDPGSLVYSAWNSHRNGRQHTYCLPYRRPAPPRQPSRRQGRQVRRRASAPGVLGLVVDPPQILHGVTPAGRYHHAAPATPRGGLIPLPEE